MKLNFKRRAFAVVPEAKDSPIGMTLISRSIDATPVEESSEFQRNSFTYVLESHNQQRLPEQEPQPESGYQPPPPQKNELDTLLPTRAFEKSFDSISDKQAYTDLLYTLSHAIRIIRWDPLAIKQHFLSVPPTMRTAKEAVAWAFEMSEHEYSPNRQT